MADATGELTGVDPTAVLALAVAGCVALFYYLWSSKNSSSTGGKGGGNDGKTNVDRIAEAQRHSKDKVDVESAAAECKSTGRPWKDPTFGHDPYPGDSIGHHLELRDGERGKPLVLGKDGVTWQPPSKFAASSRPLGVRGDGVPTWLYSDNDGDGIVSAAESMEVDDVRQGSVGDCYFLAALSAVVQHHPDLADDLIDETYEEYGIYGVSFWRGGKWRMTWVDSYFPCYRPSAKTHRGKHRLVFAGATDRKEIWPLVVEKAFAKAEGSYEAIAGGRIAEALGMLTGGKARRREPGRMGAGTAEWETFKEEVRSDEYWVGAGSQRQRFGADAAAEQTKALRGIVTGHAYAVLAVYEDEDDDGLLRLVELRNPWGHGEWTGDWGPGSRKWDTEEGRKAVSVVGPSRSNDGRFWMAWEDFVDCFDSVDTCCMNFTDEDRARRAALKEEAARIIAKKDRPKRQSSSAAEEGGDEDGKPEYTQEDVDAADAMMAQLLAEEAKEKRMKKKKGTKKNTRRK